MTDTGVDVKATLSDVSLSVTLFPFTSLLHSGKEIEGRTRASQKEETLKLHYVTDAKYHIYCQHASLKYPI